MKGYIGTVEAAKRLGVTRRRVLQLIQSGQIRAEKMPVSGYYLIPERDFEKFLQHVWPTVEPRGVQRGVKRNLSSAPAEGT